MTAKRAIPLNPVVVYRALGSALCAGALALGTLPAAAQPPGMGGPIPVGFTEAREHSLRPTVRLSGTVETRRSSLVASEVAGLVTDLLAREGDLLQKGRAVVRLRRQDLELRLAAQQASLKEAQARLELATRNLQRARDLYADEVISRQDLDNAVSEETAWAGRVESLKAEIARVVDNLARSEIAAPFTGVVVREHTQVGEWIGVGDPVVELMDMEELEVVVEVPERNFRSLERGTAARVTFEALPGVVIHGEVNAVIPQADRETRTFPVKVRFPNRRHNVGVGMLAQVELPVGSASEVLIVPKDAVLRRGGARAVVYRIAGGGTVEEVEVQPGIAGGAWIAVQGELAPGDRVVTRGNERLRPGQQVEGSPVSYELP